MKEPVRSGFLRVVYYRRGSKPGRQLISSLKSKVGESKLVTHRKILKEIKHWNSKDKTIWHRREGKHGLNTQGGGRQLDTGDTH